MGYNLTRHSVIRQLPQLEQLAQSKESLRFLTDEPRRLAYKIREAIHSCAAFPEFHHLHASIWPRFRLREVPQAVIAEYIGEKAHLSLATPMGQPLSHSQLDVAPQRKVLADPTTLLEVISSAISFDKTPELFFPNVKMSDGERLRLYKWTTQGEWLYIDHDDGGLTLTQLEVEDGLAWEPA